jgi:DNA primase
MANFLDYLIDYANQSLPDSTEALDYLGGRGVNSDLISSFKLGFLEDGFITDVKRDERHSDECYDPDSKNKWCDSCRFNKWSVSQDASGNWIAGGKLSGVLVYPLTSYSGRIFGIQIRSLKEKNYDTYMLKHRPEATFFGLAPQMMQIWNEKSVAVAEGPFDMLTIKRFTGLPVLALNTNSLNHSQITFIRRFANRVYLFLDKDEAGRNGARSAVERLSSSVEVRDVKWWSSLVDAKDPNDFWRLVGDSKFQSHIKKCLL